MSGSSLQKLGAAFKDWRSNKPFRAKIPEELWALAVSASRDIPISHIAKATGLNFYQLRARVEKHKATERAVAPINVTKVVGAVGTSSAPLLEVETVTGVKLRFFNESDAMRAVLTHLLGGG